MIATATNTKVAAIPVGTSPGGWPLGHDAFNLQLAPVHGLIMGGDRRYPQQ